jgi:hypothetical protein
MMILRMPTCSIARLHRADPVNKLVRIRIIMLFSMAFAKSRGHKNADFLLERISVAPKIWLSHLFHSGCFAIDVSDYKKR